MENKSYGFLKTFGILAALDIIVWIFILFPAGTGNLEVYFLEVGQGDSSLVVFPNRVKLLIDGGPINGMLEKNLEKILSIFDRRIDLVMASHPQQDHFGGLIDILRNYEIGVFLNNGEQSQSAAWRELENVIKIKKIPQITLRAGDKISYQDVNLRILSPQGVGSAKDINDSSLVGLLAGNKSPRVLFTGDITAATEKQLGVLYDIDVDILKVSHHGSKYSSNLNFLKEASPSVAVIGVGKNSYGHPTPEALGRLANIGSQVYRTDKDGLVKIIFTGGRLKVFTKKL